MWAGQDSNLRRHNQQIYSLPHLTALVPTHFDFRFKILDFRFIINFKICNLKSEIILSRCADLNRGPTPYHGVALPAELQRRD